MKKINKITSITLIFMLIGVFLYGNFAYSADILRVPINTEQTIKRVGKAEAKIKLADIISNIGNKEGPLALYNMRPFNVESFIDSVEENDVFKNHYGGNWTGFIKDLENKPRSAAYKYLLSHLQTNHKTSIYRIKEEHELIKEMVPELLSDKIKARKAGEPVYIRLVTLGGGYDPFSLGTTLIESIESELKNNYSNLTLGKDVVLEIQDVQIDPGANDEIRRIKEFTLEHTGYRGYEATEEVREHIKAVNKNRARLSDIIKFRYGSIGDTRPDGIMSDVLKNNPDLVTCNLVFYHLDAAHQKKFIDFIGQKAPKNTTFMFAFNVEMLTYGTDRYVNEFNGDKELALQVRPTYAKDYPPLFEKYFEIRNRSVARSSNSSFYFMKKRSAKREEAPAIEEKHDFDHVIASNQTIKINLAPGIEDWARKQISNAQNSSHFIEEIASQALKKGMEEISIDYADISLLSEGRLHKYSYLVEIKLKTGELIAAVIKSYKFNRQNRFEKEIEALKFLDNGNVPEYYGTWVSVSEDINKNQKLDENNYMFFAESFEEGLTLEDYIKSIKDSPDYRKKAGKALILAIKKYASIQQKSAGKFQLVNINPKNIIIYEFPSGKLRAKVMDTGGQIDSEDPARWLSDIKEKLIMPITSPDIELRHIISDKIVFSIAESMIKREPLSNLTKKLKCIGFIYSRQI